MAAVDPTLEFMVEEDELRWLHVYPLFGRAHDTEHGDQCWCHPEHDAEFPRIIVHNAMH